MDHIERMEKELEELREKTRKAGQFFVKELDNPKILDHKQIVLLGMQSTAMSQYEAILEERIAYDKEKLSNIGDNQND